MRSIRLVVVKRTYNIIAIHIILLLLLCYAREYTCLKFLKSTLIIIIIMRNGNNDDDDGTREKGFNIYYCNIIILFIYDRDAFFPSYIYIVYYTTLLFTCFLPLKTPMPPTVYRRSFE